MAVAPFLIPRRRALSPRRWATAQVLAMTLMLLVTQQWGLVHWLQHRGSAATTHEAGPRAWGEAASAAAADSATDSAADTGCGLCLALAGLGALALPQPVGWATSQAESAAPVTGSPAALRATGSAPFQARAPPVLS